MPKKTRRQKILASERRYKVFHPKLSEPVKSQNLHETSEAKISIKPEYKFGNNIIPKPKTISATADYSYLKKDLIRITIFVILAISAQSVLYFFLR